MPRVTIPNNATVLPWSYVFLILFMIISVCSSVMSMIDNLLAKKPQAPADVSIYRQTLAGDVTDPPVVLPETKIHRYVMVDQPEQPLEYLFSDSVTTR